MELTIKEQNCKNYETTNSASKWKWMNRICEMEIWNWII